MASELKLEWRVVPAMDEQVWVADFGAFRAEVWWSGIGWPWQVGRPSSRHDGIDGVLTREVRIVESTTTLLAAQLAAESAARDLLCGALAAFAGESRDFTVIRDRYAACPDAYLARDNRRGHAFFAMSKDEMRTLALALLKASEEETP